MWFALAGGAKLRGVCSEGGAYNFVFRFFVVGTGRPVPANFRIPWRAPSADDASLVNPSLSKDGLILSSFTKGIGVGVCGEGADWIWTGTQFRLFRFIEMRECRGLPSEDWPVVYRARMN